MPFLDGWTKQKSITIPAGYITGSLTNFPLSVQFTDDAEIGAAALANGFDIRFTLSDGITVLSCYRRSFSITGGLATGIYDVLVPSLTSGVPGSLLCQYGNAAAADVSSSSAVFGAAGAGYAGAWGFGDGVTLDLTDLTGNGNDGTNNGATAAAGIVGGAANFNGGNWITFPAAGTTNISDPITISAWVNASVLNGLHDIIGPGYSAFGLGWQNGASKYGVIHNGVAFTVFDANSDTQTGVWKLLTGTHTGTHTKFYKDGVETGSSDSDTSDYSLTESVGYIGRATINYGWQGLIDEPRISAVARSAPWIYLDWAQVANQSEVVLKGAEETVVTPARLIRPLIRPLILPMIGA